MAIFFCAGHEAVILIFYSRVCIKSSAQNFDFTLSTVACILRILRIYPGYHVALAFSATLLIYITLSSATLAQYGSNSMVLYLVT